MSVWKKVPNDKDKVDSNPRIIQSETHIEVEIPDPDIHVEFAEQIISDDVEFYGNNGSNGQSNSQSLDPDLSPLTYGFISRLLRKEKQIGFMLSIIHSIQVNSAFCRIDDDKEEEEKDIVPLIFTTGLATYLAVDGKERKNRLADIIILAQMKNCEKSGIQSAYFFAPKPRSYSSVMVQAWYRPLDVYKAKECGYTIVIPNSIEELKNSSDEVKMEYAVKFYGFKSKQKFDIKQTKLSHFDLRPDRVVSVATPTDKEWRRLKTGSIKWKTLYIKETPVMMFAYRPYNIKIPITIKGNEPFYITASSCQICYCETLKKCDSLEMSNMFNEMFDYLKSKKYVAAHGVTMGCFSYEKSQFLGPLLGVKTNHMYVDFYNLCTGRTRHSKDISLLYV